MKIDFHTHTRHSPDSMIKPGDLARKAKSLGIIPAITDHNTMEAHRHMESLKAEFIPGVEIQTDRGDLTGLYLEDPVRKGTAFSETLDLIREQGGIAYLPHMYDKTRHGAVPKEDEIKKIDIIEIFNARCLDPACNSRARAFAQKHKKLQAAGTDSHFLFEFGSTYTELPDFDIENPSRLLSALRDAAFTTKRAPFYVRGTTSLVKLGRKFLG